MFDFEGITPLIVGGTDIDKDGTEVFYPDGDLAAMAYGNTAALPDPINSVEMATLLAAAPRMYKALVLAEHKIDEHLQGQYLTGQALGATLKDIREALAEADKPS